MTSLWSICSDMFMFQREYISQVFSIVIPVACEICLVSWISLSLCKQAAWKCVKARANKESSSLLSGGLQAVMKIRPSLHGGEIILYQ